MNGTPGRLRRCGICFVIFCSVLTLRADTASEALKAKAASGDAMAQNRLGTEYRLQNEFSEALAWYGRSARQGYATAEFNIGTIYYNGNGMPSDTIEAYAWFLIARAAGEDSAAEAVSISEHEISPASRAEGQLRAVTMLRSGNLVPRNTEAAFALLRALADKHNPIASVRLALALIVGTELPKDTPVAEQYCRTAASQNYPPGMVCLAYLAQINDPKQYKKAFEWYQRATRSGSPAGLYGLGQLYADGLGVKKDSLKAALYFLQASRTLRAAQQALALVEPRLSDKQRNEFQKELKQSGPAGQSRERLGDLSAPYRSAEVLEFPLAFPITQDRSPD